MSGEFEGEERRHDMQIWERVMALDARVLVHDEQIRNIVASLDHHTRVTERMLTRITSQLESMRQLVWIGVGGVIVLGGIAGIIFAHIRILMA